jgi:hypothetical protein
VAPLRNEAEVFQQTKNVVLKLPNIGSILNAFSTSLVGHAADLLTHILAFYAIPFGTRHAVYDPVLSLWPFGQLPLYRLRLDLLYPKSLFSHCPSRRRGKSEGTIHGSPLLRVFKQNSEEVASLIFSEQKDWLRFDDRRCVSKVGGVGYKSNARCALFPLGKSGAAGSSMARRRSSIRRSSTPRRALLVLLDSVN